MFGMSNAGLSAADVAAVTNGNGTNGWGNGDGWWVLIILFALFGGWGRGGLFGGNGGAGCGCDSACATVGDVQRGFDNQSVINKLNGIEQGISQIGYADLQQFNNITNGLSALGYQTQNAITQAQIAQMQSANALQAQLADCCCENRAAIAQVRYDMSTNTCAVTTAIANAARDIADNQNANYRALHDEIVANRMEDKNAQIDELRSQVQALNLAQSQANQNRYLIDQLRPCPQPAYITCNPWGTQQPYGSCYTAAGCACC